MPNPENLGEIDRQIASVVIISQDHKFLFGRKDPAKGGVYPNAWHIPGGGVDARESLIDAAKREAKEEAGVDLAGVTLTELPAGHGATTKTLSSGEKVWCNMTFNRFEAKINQPAAEINTRPGDDLVELRWFTAAELLDQPLVPGTIELFKTAGYLSLHFTPALDRPDLLAPSTRETIERATNPADILVAEIDPAAAATDLFNQRYHFDPAAGANCVIIQATRGDTTKYAAVLVQPGTRADLNGLVRKHLDARRVSFAPHDLTLELTGMEYGSINPIGLPADWPVLIDQRVMQAERVIIGSGLVRSKLYVRPQTIAQLTGGEVLDLVKA